MRLNLFFDIDDTVASSANRHARETAGNAQAQIQQRIGNNLIISRKQHLLTHLLAQRQSHFYAVTARDLANIHNIAPLFAPFLAQSATPHIHLIANFGAIQAKLRASAPHPDQIELFDLQNQPSAAPFQAALTALSAQFQRVEIKSDNHIPCYLKIKDDTLADATLRARLAEQLAQWRDFALRKVRNGYYVLIPHAYTKEHRVAQILQQLPPNSLNIGFGNATSDLPFMLLMDYLITPCQTNPQIHRLLQHTRPEQHFQEDLYR